MHLTLVADEPSSVHYTPNLEEPDTREGGIAPAIPIVGGTSLVLDEKDGSDKWA